MENGPFKLPGLAPSRAIGSPGGLPWIPWRWVRTLYKPGCAEGLATLFKAYHEVQAALDIGEITAGVPPRHAEDACRRCGQCCAQLIPEPVCEETLDRWAKAGNPVHRFHHPITEGPLAGRFHTGWYHEGVRLRICPLLLRDPATGDKFCVVYHLGPGQRPPGCEGFRPNWPHCEVSQRPLVP